MKVLRRVFQREEAAMEKSQQVPCLVLERGAHRSEGSGGCMAVQDISEVESCPVM